MEAAIVPQPPWCPPLGAEAYNNQPRPLDGRFLPGEGALGSDGMPLR